jgi:hypothetical protein
VSDGEVLGYDESESLPHEGSDVDKKEAVHTYETPLVTVG